MIDASRWRHALAAAALVAAGCGPSTPAPLAPTPAPSVGTLTGRVTSVSSGDPVAGATVRAGSVSATTNATGDYIMGGAPIGLQTVTTTAAGFATRTDPVTISAGGSTTFSPALTPTLPSTEPGTIVSLVSGETGEPVGGASVAVSGQSAGGTFNQTYTSDASGRFSVDAALLPSPAPLLEVTAGGYLVRSTLLRPDETTLSLWPATSPTGLDEAFSATIGYSSSACPAVNTGLSSLRRAGSAVSTIQVSFGPSLQDPAAESTHQQAIARVNAAFGGAPRYEFTAAASGGTVSFVAEINPSHSTCTAGPEPLRAATSLTFQDGTISGGRLVYCTVAAARSIGLVLHELGHTVGLYHSPSTSDVMYCSSGRPVVFSLRERLVMHLMRQRRSGNRWPDNDRQAAALLRIGSGGTEVITCGAGVDAGR